MAHILLILAALFSAPGVPAETGFEGTADSGSYAVGTLSVSEMEALTSAAQTQLALILHDTAVKVRQGKITPDEGRAILARADALRTQVVAISKLPPSIGARQWASEVTAQVETFKNEVMP